MGDCFTTYLYYNPFLGMVFKEIGYKGVDNSARIIIILGEGKQKLELKKET